MFMIFAFGSIEGNFLLVFAVFVHGALYACSLIPQQHFEEIYPKLKLIVPCSSSGLFEEIHFSSFHSNQNSFSTCGKIPG